MDSVLGGGLSPGKVTEMSGFDLWWCSAKAEKGKGNSFEWVLENERRLALGKPATIRLNMVIYCTVSTLPETARHW